MKPARHHGLLRRHLPGEILGQLDMHGAGFFHPRQPHRLAHDLRNGLGVADRDRPLGDGLEHAHDIHHLVGFLVQAFGRALAGEHQHRRAIHVGVGDPGNQVQYTGPVQAAGGIAGQTPVHLRHEGRALLVTGEDKFDFPAVFEGEHEIGVFLTGDAENVFDTFFFEAGDKQIGRFPGQAGVSFADRGIFRSASEDTTSPTAC